MKDKFNPHRLIVLAIAIVVIPLALMGAQIRDSRPADSTRACTPASGNAQVISTSTGASAAVTELDPDSVYIVSCTTATHLATGATAPTATTSNFLFPAGVFPIRTYSGPNGTGITHIALRAATAAGTCYVTACK